MKGAICTGFNMPLELQDLTLGSPIGHEIKVRIDAVAICHSDISFIKGYWGGTLPAIYGHEAAGTILETGNQISNFKVGQRVIVTLMRSCRTCSSCAVEAEALCASPPELHLDAKPTEADGTEIFSAMNTGAFAEEVIIHESQIVPLPDDVSTESGALIGCGVITGYGAVCRVAKVKEGETVAVIGCGGVGINAIQAAKICKASKIAAIDPATSKEVVCRNLGATDFINPLEDTDFETAKSVTNGIGFDVVLVAVGSVKVITEALVLLRPGGRLVVMGMPPSGDLADIDMTSLAAQGQSILGTKMGSAVIRKDIPEIIRLYREGEWVLDALVSDRFSFEDINAALERAEHPDSFRVVVKMEDAETRSDT